MYIQYVIYKFQIVGNDSLVFLPHLLHYIRLLYFHNKILKLYHCLQSIVNFFAFKINPLTPVAIMCTARFSNR
jgi:hypothetical protein